MQVAGIVVDENRQAHKRALGRRHRPRPARIGLDRHAQGAGDGLERGFGNVVAVDPCT